MTLRKAKKKARSFIKAVLCPQCQKIVDLRQDPEDVLFLDYEIFRVVDADLGTGIPVEEDLVADLQGLHIIANSLYLAALPLFLGAVRDLQPACGLLQLLRIAYEHPVLQRLKFDSHVQNSFLK